MRISSNKVVQKTAEEFSVVYFVVKIIRQKSVKVKLLPRGLFCNRALCWTGQLIVCCMIATCSSDKFYPKSRENWVLWKWNKITRVELLILFCFSWYSLDSLLLLLILSWFSFASLDTLLILFCFSWYSFNSL